MCGASTSALLPGLDHRAIHISRGVTSARGGAPEARPGLRTRAARSARVLFAHPWLHLAAVARSLRAPLVLVTAPASAILGGLATIAVAAACSRRPSGIGSSRPARRSASSRSPVWRRLFVTPTRAGDAVRPRRGAVPAPVRLGADHRFSSDWPRTAQIGRLLPLYVVLAAAVARARLAARPRRAAARRRRRRSRSRSRAFVSFAAVSVLWSGPTWQRGTSLAVLPVSRSSCSSPSSRGLRSPLDAACARRSRARARGALRGGGPRRGGRRAAALLHARDVEVGEHVLVLLPGHVAVQAIRASTAATSCSRSPSCSSAAWSRGDRGRSRRALRVPLRRSLLLVLAVELRSRSCVALFVAVVAGGRRVRIVAAAPRVVVLAAGGAFAADEVAGSSTQRVTSGRSRRVELTLEAFADHPLVGVGIGSQPRASAGDIRDGGPPSSSPRTRRRSRSPPSSAWSASPCTRCCFAGASAGALLACSGSRLPSGWRSAAVFLALLVHSLVLRAGSSRTRSRGSSLGVTSSSSRTGAGSRRPVHRARTQVARRAAFAVLGVLGGWSPSNVAAARLGSSALPTGRPWPRPAGSAGPRR